MPVLRSMTGFARLRKLTDAGEMTMTIKSVNHRSLDVHMHLPADLDAYDQVVRNTVKKAVSRGHVDVRLVWNRTGQAQPLALNQTLLSAWLTAFMQAKQAHGLDSQPDLNIAFRIPGMLVEADAEPDQAIEAAFVELTEEALRLFNESRAKEGASLAVVIREANGRIQLHALEMGELRGRAMPLLQDRLQERLTVLLASASVEPQRLVQEAAILADRSDITEEIHRLTIHSKQLDELLDKGGEVGKKLDFLMQEMGRETNTILSKTNGAGDLGLRITDLGIAVKAEIERIREQSLNLE
ncbi:MAG: YicC family protein [Acidobacteria bacterium]|nr:YicC family protein [Acidobacteriota bacterium]